MTNLLVEDIDMSLIESSILDEAGVKNHYIQGIFMMSDVKNGNGRIYPKTILEREVGKLFESKIKTNRLLGELDHPSQSGINLDRVSHVIKELKMDGANVIGKAQIIDTPCGKIAKSLLEAGVRLGVSSRGTGSVKNGIVQSDLRMSTIDIVADPSAPDAFVNHILESKTEWVLENGILTEKEIEKIIDSADQIVIENKYSKEDQQSALVKLFNEALTSIAYKKK